MAMIWADGFDHYGNDTNLQLQSIYEVDWHLDTTIPRTGAGCARLFAFGTTGGINFPASVGNAGFVGFAFRTDQVSGDRRYNFANGTNKIFSWRTEGSGALSIWLGEISTQIYDGVAGQIAINSWNYIEFGWTSSATGTITCRLNGVVIYAGTNLNIATQINCMRWLISGGNAYIDDLVIMDATGTTNNGLIGDVRCRTLLPASNGPTQAWVPTGDTSNYLAVGHVPPVVATYYAAGAAVNDAVDFNVAALPTNTASVFAVVEVNQLSKTDAGICTVQPALVSNGVSANGNAVNPGTGPNYYQSIFQVDPNGGGPWTKAAVNAARPKLTRSA